MSDLDLTPNGDTSRSPREQQSGDGRKLEDLIPESLLPEFDRICANQKELSQNAGKIERGYLHLAQQVQSKQKLWHEQHQHVAYLEKENFKLRKDLNRVSNKLKQADAEIEAKVDKCRSLEAQIEEMREAFELMSEIIFDDEPDMSGSRRAELEAIQSSFKRCAKSKLDNNESSVQEETEQSVVSMSDQESELNGAYGDLYTSVVSRKRRAKEWVSSAPMPSGRSSIPARPPPPALPLVRTLPPPMSPVGSPSRNSKLNRMFIEEPSFSVENIPPREEIYEPETPPRDNELRHVEMLPAVDGMPTELVLFVSALTNKLGHPDLYVTSPETEEVQLIDTIKGNIRNLRSDENAMLAELNAQSTNVLCQLVKDFFHDNEEKIFKAQSELMGAMMLSVRCCNVVEIERLVQTLKPLKQLQLAFLMRHLQSAVDAGRLPGELADAFGTVIVSPGARNRNDPKELCEKLILLDAQFYVTMMEAASVKRVQDDERSQSSLSSMLGPVAAVSDGGSQWKKMIEERKHKLLQSCDLKLFTSPKV